MSEKEYCLKCGAELDFMDYLASLMFMKLQICNKCRRILKGIIDDWIKKKED